MTLTTDPTTLEPLPVGTNIVNPEWREDLALQEELRKGTHYTEYCAWNFCGIVWFDGRAFCCNVYRHGGLAAKYEADTLDVLVRDVQNDYGHE